MVVIIHLAGEHRDDVRPLSLYEEVNVGGAENVVAAARLSGCKRIIFTSSVAVYPLNVPSPTENNEPKPFNPYGESKLKAEEVFRRWAQETPGATLVIVRLCVVFGEGNRGNVYNLLSQIHRQRFLMVGRGLNRKSMAYVGNVSRFLAGCLAYPPGTHLLNYADKPDLSVVELVAIARRELGVLSSERQDEGKVSSGRPIAHLDFSLQPFSLQRFRVFPIGSAWGRECRWMGLPSSRAGNSRSAPSASGSFAPIPRLPPNGWSGRVLCARTPWKRRWFGPYAMSLGRCRTEDRRTEDGGRRTEDRRRGRKAENRRDGTEDKVEARRRTEADEKAEDYGRTNSVVQGIARLSNSVRPRSTDFPGDKGVAAGGEVFAGRPDPSLFAGCRGKPGRSWAKRRYPAHFVSKLTDADGELQETLHWLGTAPPLAATCPRRSEEALALLCQEIGRKLGKMMQNPESFTDHLRHPPSVVRGPSSGVRLLSSAVKLLFSGCQHFPID